MTEDSDKPAQRKRHLWPWLVGGLLALIVLSVAVAEIAAIPLERQVDRRIAELRAQGYPTTLAECAPAPVPAERNAGVIYEALFAQRGPSDLAALAGRAYRLFDGETPQARQARADFLARPDVVETLAKLQRAAELPDCLFAGMNWRTVEPTDVVSWLPGPAMGRASSLVRLRVQSLAERGKAGDAIEWTFVGVRQADHYRRVPTLISQLEGVAYQAMVLDSAWRGLRDADVPAPASASLRDYLLSVNLMPFYRRSQLTERAYDIAIYECWARSGSGYTFAERPRNVKAVRGWLYCSSVGTYWRAQDELVMLDQTARGIAMGERSWYQVSAQAKELQAEVDSHRSLLGWWVVGPVGGALEKANASQASRESFALALAAKAYKYERGTYPDSLKDLSAYLGKDLPKDPFTGQDYGYTRRGQGFMLWSEYQDDSGKRRFTWDADK